MGQISEVMTSLADEVRELSGSTSKKTIETMQTDIHNANAVIEEQSGTIEKILELVQQKASPQMPTDKDLIPENIKKDVEIFGVVGTYEGEGGGNLAQQILLNKTFNDDNITEIPNDGFRGWQSIEHVNMPSVTNIGQYAFYNCVGLKEIDFPNCTSIGNYAFYNNTDVVYVNLPRLTKMGTNTLRQLTAIISITLPACTAIAGTAFQKCTSLKKADFFVAQSIGANAFNGCSALTTLILRSDTLCTLANVSAFTSTPIASGSGHIYVPSSLIDNYKDYSNWSTFSAQFRAIEDYPDICG